MTEHLSGQVQPNNSERTPVLNELRNYAQRISKGARRIGARSLLAGVIAGTLTGLAVRETYAEPLDQDLSRCE